MQGRGGLTSDGGEVRRMTGKRNSWKDWEEGEREIGATGRMRRGGGAGGGEEMEGMAARRSRGGGGGIAMTAEKNRGRGKEWRRSSRQRRLDSFPGLP